MDSYYREAKVDNEYEDTNMAWLLAEAHWTQSNLHYRIKSTRPASVRKEKRTTKNPEGADQLVLHCCIFTHYISVGCLAGWPGERLGIPERLKSIFTGFESQNLSINFITKQT